MAFVSGNRIFNHGTFVSPRRVLISTSPSSPLFGGFSLSGAVRGARRGIRSLSTGVQKVLESDVAKEGKKILKEIASGSGKGSKRAQKALTAADFVGRISAAGARGGITRQSAEMAALQPRAKPHRGSLAYGPPKGNPIGYSMGSVRRV